MVKPSKSQTPPRRDFLSVARDLSMLTAETAADLTVESSREGVSAAELAMRKGLLEQTQVEIVDTLSRPDDAIEGYEILDLIGRGGMGVVYRAQQKNLGRIVALKTVQVGLAANPKTLTRFEQEARAVARLQHPNIVAAYDYGRCQGRLYFAMELVEGEDAGKLIQREGKLDERTTWGLIRQAAAGLAHAHEAGIIHRDIKPANLLLVKPPRGYHLPPGLPMVKIGDFGLAFLEREQQADARLTLEGSTLGTPHYLAPDQMLGEEPDCCMDIYSLGATAYHMLSGERLFDGDERGNVLSLKMRTEAPPIRSRAAEVSAAGEALIAHMLQRQRSERLGDYGELLSRIDAILAALEGKSAPNVISGKPEPAPAAAVLSESSPRRRRRMISALAALIMLPLVALIIWLIVAGKGDGSLSEPPVKPDMISTGWASALFDGRTLEGWIIDSGEWTDALDRDGGTVLAGSDGMIRRPLLNPSEPGFSPIEQFNLRFLVQLNGASNVQMHFQIAAPPDGKTSPGAVTVAPDNTRLELRIDVDRAAVSYQGDHRPKGRYLAPPIPLSNGKDGYHAVRLMRGPDRWWVWFEDVLLASVPIESVQLPEIRLVVKGGPAWFSDMFIEELKPAQASP